MRAKFDWPARLSAGEILRLTSAKREGRAEGFWTAKQNDYQMESDYIFVSYAHKDKKAVLKEIAKREKKGQHFWYDKNIDAGADWAETIGKKLERASSVLYFESNHSKKSENCRRELTFASEHNIPVEMFNLGGPAGVVAGIVCAAVVLALLFYFVAFKYVPDVIGFKTEDALKKLDEYGYSGIVRYEYSADCPLGFITKQKPADKAVPIIPVTISQSLGPESSLTIAPDTVGSYISDGIQMLVNAGLMKFTINSENLESNDFGTITYQTAPAGYKVSTDSNVGLSVATDENPVVFTFNGIEITIPAEADISVELDLIGNTVVTVESYVEREFDNAEYINLESADWTFVSSRIYNVPVVISGLKDSKIAFSDCVFNDDIIIKTENQNVVVGIEGSCTVKGKLCIINNIMNADITTQLPKFWIEETLPVVVEHGSGTCFMFADKDVIFNGETYSFEECEYYVDGSDNTFTLIPVDSPDAEPLMYVLSCFMKNGQELIMQMASNMTVPGRD